MLSALMNLGLGIKCTCKRFLANYHEITSDSVISNVMNQVCLLNARKKRIAKNIRANTSLIGSRSLCKQKHRVFFF